MAIVLKGHEMNLIVTARTLLGRLTPRTDPVEQFRRDVDRKVTEYKLDPTLPEVIHLKDAAEEYAEDPMRNSVFRLLNPNDSVDIAEDGLVVLQERWFGLVLQPWSIARHHLRERIEDVSKIVVNGAGLTLFIDSQAVFCARGSAIDPRRLNDPGNRYANAIRVIKELTEVNLDFDEHFGRSRTITLEKQSDGSWDTTSEKIA